MAAADLGAAFFLATFLDFFLGCSRSLMSDADDDAFSSARAFFFGFAFEPPDIFCTNKAPLISVRMRFKTSGRCFANKNSVALLPGVASNGDVAVGTCRYGFDVVHVLAYDDDMTLVSLSAESSMIGKARKTL